MWNTTYLLENTYVRDRVKEKKLNYPLRFAKEQYILFAAHFIIK